MAVSRPTFHESWYRISGIRPRLRSSIQSQRQYYRHCPWYVLRDPGSNDYFRVSEQGYRFVSFLDGKRTVEEVWNLCLEQQGDDAPTQGEVVQLLGQLYQNNLLRGELPPDVDGMLQRMRQRKFREVGGYLGNILFLRIPVFDPDRILNFITPLFGWVFSLPGFLLWLGMMGLGLGAISGQWGELSDRADNVLDPSNWLWMYVCFIGIKAIHEFSHGIACKKFGQQEGAGEVHTLGVMLMVFTPMPYIDTTSSWSLRSKYRRVVVALAGMYVELAVAAFAAVLWSKSVEGSTLHALSYNVMFITSISTLLFNANPLLRYDGYYILSDWVEIPNLYQRSKNYITYLVRRNLFGVRHLLCPAHSKGEKIWFCPYALASLVYRIFICARILFFVADKLFMLGVLLAGISVFTWVLRPFWKFAVYLATNGELARTRPRAVGITMSFLCGMIYAVGWIPVKDCFLCDAIVEPQWQIICSTGGPGKVTHILETDVWVKPNQTILIQSSNQEMLAEQKQLLAEKEEHQMLERIARAKKEYALATAHREMLRASETQLELLRKRIHKLTARAPGEGFWVSPQGENYLGCILPEGQPMGMLVDIDSLRIRSVVSQSDNVRLITGHQGGQMQVNYRIWNRPDLPVGSANIQKIVPAGQEILPSAALGYFAGGAMEVDSNDQGGRKVVEPFFDVYLNPLSQKNLRPGDRVRVKYTLPDKPLLKQWARKTSQLYHKRFQR